MYSAVTSDLLRELKGHDGIVTDVKISTRNHLQVKTKMYFIMFTIIIDLTTILTCI